MEIDPLTIVAVTGVVSLIIERIFYYKSKYKSKKNGDGNPGYEGRIVKLETKVEEMDKENEKDHGLIRDDIKKIFNLINGMRK